MSYRINITDIAINDMDNIYAYIAYDMKEPAVAEKMLERLEEKINDLGNMPLKFREYEIEPGKSRGMHIMHVGNYFVLYTPNEETEVVTINRVFYGGMDIPQHL